MVSSIYSYHWWLPAIYFFHLERVKQDLRFAQPGPLLANEQYRESNHIYIACCTLQPQHALRACHRSTLQQVEKYILVVQNLYGSLWLYVTRIIFSNVIGCLLLTTNEMNALLILILILGKYTRNGENV